MFSLRKTILFVVASIALTAAAPALAGRGFGNDGYGRRDRDGYNHRDRDRDHRHKKPRPGAVPEFDPSAVGAVAAMVGLGGVLVARRRKKA